MYTAKKRDMKRLDKEGLLQEHHIKFGPHKRSFLVYVPRSHSANLLNLPVGTGRAMLLSLHGGGGSAQAHLDYTGGIDAAERFGFVLVIPNGWHPRFKSHLLTWNAGPNQCGPASRHHIDDVGFLIRVIDIVKMIHKIDPQRVYCTGHSNGGMMAYRLAASAEGSTRIAAFSAVGGCICITAAQFQAIRPISVMHIHSHDDPRALFSGGEGPPFPMTKVRCRHPAVPDVIGQWVNFNRCSTTPTIPETEVQQQLDGTTHTVSREVYSHGTGGSQVVLVKLTGAGHVWPRIRTGKQRQKAMLAKVLGSETEIVDAHAEMWAFFIAHPFTDSSPAPINAAAAMSMENGLQTPVQSSVPPPATKVV